jgi:cysteine synthase A
MPISNSIIDTIGRTPLVALDRLTGGLNRRVLAKVEFFNPGGSVKDRIALRMIEEAERKGILKPGGTVVELTSGNTGTGLAVVCAVKGYRMIAVMSEGNSVERRQMLKAVGAEVELVPQARGSAPGQVSGEDLALVEQRAAELTRRLKAFRPDQFNNPSNVEAHEATTGREILEQTDGRLDGFVAAVGTGGTFIGVARVLKKHNPAIRCYAVEPATAAYLAGKKVTRQRHKIQGAGYALTPPLWDTGLCDGFLTATDTEAIRTARRLGKTEGIFAGFSSGANLACALKLARKLNEEAVVVTVLPDTGLKYLSTDLVEG